ncbi:hypothetical protein BGZ96_011586 [Linnemannia gamsii]|uniref:Uncharacterized protein n=1 Tax=Linnemannia gamsii TaxID=64522 RepID=A0ABQ7KE33_9FUNG|nr:hypothetical protein BGZ96_011586 [Linnemannia gamsii]
MLPSVTACTLTLFSALALASTASAAVLSSDPTGDTRWKIGSSLKIRWRLDSPTPKNHLVSIFIVGGGEAPETAAAVADKSTPVVAGSTQNAETPNGPVTLIQNAAKGAQPHATGSANANSRLGAQGIATIAIAAAISAIGLALF